MLAVVMTPMFVVAMAPMFVVVMAFMLVVMTPMFGDDVAPMLEDRYDRYNCSEMEDDIGKRLLVLECLLASLTEGDVSRVAYGTGHSSVTGMLLLPSSGDVSVRSC